jgi:YVTN family beta-propeller protein
MKTNPIVRTTSFLTISFLTISFITLLLLNGCNKMNMDEYQDVNYDAVYVVNGESSTLSVIDLASDQVRRTFPLGATSMSGMGGNGGMNGDLMWPHHFSLNPANNQLAIGVPGMDLSAGHSGGMEGMSGKIALVSATDGKMAQILDLPAVNHNAIYSPNGSEIWTSQMSEDGKVLVYDASSLTLKSTIPVGKEPAEITFSSDGKVAFVANGMDNTVTAIDPISKAVKATIPVGADPVGAWPAPDNKMYVDNEVGKSISIIDVVTLTVVETIQLGFTPAYAAYRAGASPELWVTDTDHGVIHYFLRMNGGWMNHGNVATGAGAHAIAFTKDGRKAYVTNQMAGTVSVLDAVEKKKIRDVPVGLKPNGILLRYH